MFQCSKIPRPLASVWIVRRPFRSLHIAIWKKLIVRLVVTVKVEQWGGAALRQNWSVASTFLGEHCSVGINDDRATWRAGWRRTPSGLSLDLVTSCSPAFERHTVAVGAAR